MNFREILLNWILNWIIFWQNSNIELNQFGYRSPLVLAVYHHLRGERYPCFVIEWIYCWIESCQIQHFESNFELNFFANFWIEYFFELQIFELNIFLNWIFLQIFELNIFLNWIFLKFFELNNELNHFLAKFKYWIE